MKVQYVSSACVLVEHQGTRVLCDPWLTEGIYYGSWYHFPPLTIEPENFKDVDYLYITHIHPDHCDAASLKRLPKSIPILILDYQEKFLFRMIKGLGFDKVIEVPHGEAFELAPDFTLSIYAADNCNPTLCGRWLGCHVHDNPTKTLQIDSLAVFKGGGKVLVNTNDCPYELSKVVCEKIVKNSPKIDFLLVGYSGAGPYPQCFANLTTEEKIVAAENKKQQFLNQAMSYITLLKPAYFLPFAGQYTLGGSLSALNRYRGVPELEELTDLFGDLLDKAHSSSKLVLLNSMESFDCDTEKASASFVPPDPEERRAFVEQQLKGIKYSYEMAERHLHSLDEFFEKLQFAHQHMRSKLIHYGFNSTTQLYLDIGEKQLFAIPYDGSDCKIVDRGEVVEPYVLIRLHPGLLEMILARGAHWNNAEIGSHLHFQRSPNTYERGIYHFLSYLN